MNESLDKAYWVGLLVSIGLPVLVGLVTKHVTHPGVKAVLLLALSTLTGFLTEFANPGPDWDFSTAAILALVSFAVGVLSHFGLWKPTGVSGRAQSALGGGTSPRAV
jgi:di/tricarboxylate transporter